MSKHSPDKLTRQARFVRSCVSTFIRNKEVAQLTVQNEHCAITIVRDMPEQTTTHAIGFDCSNAVTADD